MASVLIFDICITVNRVGVNLAVIIQTVEAVIAPATATPDLDDEVTALEEPVLMGVCQSFADLDDRVSGNFGGRRGVSDRVGAGGFDNLRVFFTPGTENTHFATDRNPVMERVSGRKGPNWSHHD